MNWDAIDRRDFIKLMAAAGLGGPALLEACASAAGGGGSSGATGEIVLAGVDPLSGPYAQPGIDTDKASKVAVEHIGKVISKNLKYVGLDTQGKVDQGRRVVTDAMQSKGIKFFFGAASSSVGLAISDVVNSNGGVFFTSVGADEVTGKDCRKSTFRWSVPTYGAVHETVLPLIKSNPNLKRWYAITPNYVFGQSLLRNSQDVLSANGAQLVGNSFHSLEETQFSSYISNAVAAKPDVLLLLNFSSQNTTTLKEALAFGLKGKMTILTVWSSGLDQFQALGADATEGLYFGCQYWHTIDSPGNKAFVDLSKKTLGTVPNYPMATGYIEAKLLTDGIKKANSDDPSKVIKALEGYEYEGLTGKEHIRPQDHQVIKNYYLLKGKAKSQMSDANDFVDMVSKGQSAVPVDQTGCKM